MTTIPSFINRLKKIGLEVELVGNYPWVYLDKINGIKVKGKFHADHGFTVFFRAIRIGQNDTITDIPIVFKKIRETLLGSNPFANYEGYPMKGKDSEFFEWEEKNLNRHLRNLSEEEKEKHIAAMRSLSKKME